MHRKRLTSRRLVQVNRTPKRSYHDRAQYQSRRISSCDRRIPFSVELLQETLHWPTQKGKEGRNKLDWTSQKIVKFLWKEIAILPFPLYPSSSPQESNKTNGVPEQKWLGQLCGIMWLDPTLTWSTTRPRPSMPIQLIIFTLEYPHCISILVPCIEKLNFMEESKWVTLCVSANHV